MKHSLTGDGRCVRCGQRGQGGELNNTDCPGWVGGGVSTEFSPGYLAACRETKLTAFVAKWRKEQADSYAGAGFAVAYDAIGDLLDELEDLLK